MAHDQQTNHRPSLAAASALIGPRGAGLALGTLLDAALGDPQRGHPVAAFGTWASLVEGRLWRDSRAAGVVYVAACLAPVAALGCAAERATRGRPVAKALVTGVATWAVLGGHSLASEGRAMAAALEASDLESARGRLSHLCGRLPDDLDAPELARGCVESLAENTADSVVASLFWGAIAGVPGLLLHRAINTLDAMVGHHSERYERFGTAAARLDDAADWLPARITGVLGCALAGVVGGSPREAWRILRRDAHDHPSPNGGWCESAWAGALGVQLGGRNVYPGGRVEERGLLGDGPRPGAAEARRASALVGAVTGVAAALAVVGLAGAGVVGRRAANRRSCLPRRTHRARQSTNQRGRS